MVDPKYSAPDGASRPSKRRRNTASFREKAAATGEQVKSQGRRFLRKVEDADGLVKTAEAELRSAERGLEKLIDKAEHFLDRSGVYAKKAQDWLNEHPEYAEKVENTVEKAQELREKSMRTAREHPLPFILAGGIAAGMAATFALRSR